MDTIWSSGLGNTRGRHRKTDETLNENKDCKNTKDSDDDGNE